MSLKTDVAGTTATGDSAWAESATLIDRNRSARRDDCSAATGAIVGQSAAIHRVLAQVQQVAATDATVLLLGETGTGKEVFATRIHELSTRRAHPMVRVNCAAMPATLVESELFGREKGAFTDAISRQIGRFELADRSTIFLDEIGDLPQDVQVKLLRVIEERQIERLGSPKSIAVDTRIITATHRNLEARIESGLFRDDLYYRLNVFPIQVPPLRNRIEDIPLLIWRFIEEFSAVLKKPIDEISRENMTALQQVLVARQHPRASQRCRARDDSGDDSATHDCDTDHLGDLRGAERETGGRRKGTYPHCARERRLAHPRKQRCRGSTGAEADDAGNTDGQAGNLPAEGSVSGCRVTITAGC